MKILLSSNPYRDQGLHTALEAREILQEVGADVSICLPFALRKGDKLDLPKGVFLSSLRTILPRCDVMVCFGGDGTILHASREASLYKIPVLGVNMGSVGFMAELEKTELSALHKLVSGDYHTEQRMMLQIRHYQGKKLLFEDVALNDAVVSKGSLARVAEVELYADENHITNLTGDGVIFATPTGSTAYSMSAGGAIVEPLARCTLMTPICAHQLGARPMILAPERVITVALPQRNKKQLFFALDGGTPIPFSGREHVEITCSPRETSLVRLSSRSFFETLRGKLGGRSR